MVVDLLKYVDKEKKSGFATANVEDIPIDKNISVKDLEIMKDAPVIKIASELGYQRLSEKGEWEVCKILRRTQSDLRQLMEQEIISEDVSALINAIEKMIGVL